MIGAIKGLLNDPEGRMDSIPYFLGLGSSGHTYKIPHAVTSSRQ